ncbi:heparan-alpha-glucosaminide N-acetyltransferase-like isoform X1 [Lolium rigidum]|uniref:heparan-alpha-glucosaminide N-acetyltransferase-like isoform X1 n=1 Tax=Lolium rigidum TaxID=89674 RepID=UPI001F5C1D2F|nr:heparan-alpha-glucosaminide N-acetyltransferase-like isoform X1 [Lolium rigidum]
MDAYVVAIAGDGDEVERRRPLLAPTNEIHPYPEPPLPPQPPGTDAKPEQQKPQRVASLDVFRGLTVAMMILVDDAGGAWPGINHAPWFGVTVADFVMPAFLFIIGVSAALVFKKTPNKIATSKKAAYRAIKLFILGIILQGGYIHGRHNLTYGVDLDHIRWLGVLQRIAIGYFLAAIAEIWLVNNTLVDSPVSYMKKYYMEWIMAIMISALYIGLVFGLYVSNWEFKVQTSNSTFSNPSNEVGFKTIHCDVRGSLGPPCNAVGFVDRFLLGENHLYKNPVYKRTKECSLNSPDYGPLPPNAPDWCLAPFDPEGLLSTLMAAVSCFVGLHFGHVLIHCKNHSQRMMSWLVASTVLTVSGFLLQLLGVPFSKPLYTVSYMLLSGGVSGFLLLVLYYVVDVMHIKKPLVLFQWMGMNALIVYVLAACELFPTLIQGFYWQSPENNLVDATESLLQIIFHSERWGTLAFVLVEIIFWCLAACFLHMKGIYLKL